MRNEQGDEYECMAWIMQKETSKVASAVGGVDIMVYPLQDNTEDVRLNLSTYR